MTDITRRQMLTGALGGLAAIVGTKFAAVNLLGEKGRDLESSASAAVQETKKKKVIVLDPGHGMANRKSNVYDPGAVSGGYQEADIVLYQASVVKEILEGKGYEVHLTRSDDKTSTSLSSRAALAERVNADAFVSLHCNSFSNESANGQEAYHGKADGSAKLAGYVHGALLNSLSKGKKNVNDRGVKPGNYKVLNDAKCPSILIESGFLSNSANRAYLTDDVLDVEKAIAEGIDNYFTKEKK